MLFYREDTATTVAAIYANGNPAIFWGGLLFIPFVASAWIRRHDWVAGFITIIFAVLYLPWFLSTHPEYLFYAAPLSPVLVLAATYAVRSMAVWRIGDPGGVRPLMPVAVGYVILAVGLLAFFWPTLVANPISIDAFAQRTWLPAW